MENATTALINLASAADKRPYKHSLAVPPIVMEQQIRCQGGFPQRLRGERSPISAGHKKMARSHFLMLRRDRPEGDHHKQRTQKRSLAAPFPTSYE